MKRKMVFFKWKTTTEGLHTQGVKEHSIERYLLLKYADRNLIWMWPIRLVCLYWSRFF